MIHDAAATGDDGAGYLDEARPLSRSVLEFQLASVSQDVVLPTWAPISCPPLCDDKSGALQPVQQRVEGATLDHAEPAIGEPGGDGISVRLTVCKNPQDTHFQYPAKPLARPRLIGRHD